MGPPKAVRAISQEAFDEIVKENIDDLGMDPIEALQDAIDTLSLQGVDLSGIVQSVPGESNPVIDTLNRLKQLTSDWSDNAAEKDGELVYLLEKLNSLVSDKESGNVAIATKNGGVELVTSLLLKIWRSSSSDQPLISALTTLASLLHDLSSAETFREVGGPKIVFDTVSDGSQSISVVDSGFAVVAAAASGNEVLKESFIELNIDELIIKILRENKGGTFPCLYDAIRVLLTSDDNRVVASQVFGYARKFAKMGIVENLIEAIGEGLSSPTVVAACTALKAVAVNEEICRLVAESGGLDAILLCIDDCGKQGNKTAAIGLCNLLSKLAGSDMIKSSIMEKQGMNRLMKLSAVFSEDSSVLQEVMSVVWVLSLRSPDTAARAITAGAGDLAIQSMRRFPESDQLQKNACLMIRNLVVRNPENRTVLLRNGIEDLIRRAKRNHKCCKVAATDALRDLGLDDYNL